MDDVLNHVCAPDPYVGWWYLVRVVGASLDVLQSSLHLAAVPLQTDQHGATVKNPTAERQPTYLHLVIPPQRNEKIHGQELNLTSRRQGSG